MSEKREITGFWIGPYGIRVPNHVTYVCATDGSNTRYKDGVETERGVPKHLVISKEAYLQKHARLDEKGIWWYVIPAPAAAQGMEED